MKFSGMLVFFGLLIPQISFASPSSKTVCQTPVSSTNVASYTNNCATTLNGIVSNSNGVTIGCSLQGVQPTGQDCQAMATMDPGSFNNYYTASQNKTRLTYYSSSDVEQAESDGLAPDLQKCIDESKKADGICSPKQSQNLQAAMAIGATITQGLGTMAVGTGVEKTCEDMISTAEMAAGALNGLIAACTLASGGCGDSCSAANSEIETLAANPAPNLKAVVPAMQREYQNATKSCDSSGLALQAALSAATQIGGLVMTGQQCKGLTNASEFCQQNPTLSACASLNASVNCADPSVAATNQVCICRSNPQATGCATASQFAATTSGVQGSGVGGASGSGTGGLSAADAAAQLAGLPDPNSLNFGNNPNSAANAAANNRGFGSGGGFGGSGLGGSNTGNNGTDPSKAARSASGGSGPGWSKDVFSGFTNPGAGGSAAGGKGGANGTNIYAGNEKPNQLDLKSFLPGGPNYPKRSIAGTLDGITGQNTDIWKKLNTRYWSISPNMRP